MGRGPPVRINPLPVHAFPGSICGKHPIARSSLGHRVRTMTSHPHSPDAAAAAHRQELDRLRSARAIGSPKRRLSRSAPAQRTACPAGSRASGGSSARASIGMGARRPVSTAASLPSGWLKRATSEPTPRVDATARRLPSPPWRSRHVGGDSARKRIRLVLGDGVLKRCQQVDWRSGRAPGAPRSPPRCRVPARRYRASIRCR